MKLFFVYLQLLFTVVILASCNKNEDSIDNSIIGNWKGQTEVFYSEDEMITNVITIEYSFSKNGTFEEKVSGQKDYNDYIGDGYTLNRGNYTVVNDTIWLLYNYRETKSDSNSDIGSYVDKKDSDGNWYRYNLDDDGENWQIYSMYVNSPKFIEVSKNKYKHIYLHGEEEWLYKGRLICKMPTPNELDIITFDNILLYKLFRKLA